MNRKILIVDDERALTQLLSAHLTNEGYLVYTANHAQEAMEKLNIVPDLILLDINMPDMDGLEFCTAIRDHVSCPILFLTARVTEQDKVTGLLTGGDDYITKPFSLNELTARIAAHSFFYLSHIIVTPTYIQSFKRYFQFLELKQSLTRPAGYRSGLLRGWI